MTSRPLISVVMPTFNHGHLIGRSISSVLEQSWQHLELVIVDNYSSDNTEEIVRQFEDPRVKYIKVHNDGVIAKSRNAGIAEAKGDWIAFLDSDDWWKSTKLERCAAYFDAADVVYHRMRIVPESGFRLIGRHVDSWQVERPALHDFLTRGNPVATSALVMRHTVMRSVGGFSESRELIAAEDYNAWLKVASLTERFRFVHDVLGFYHLGLTSASRKDMSIPMSAAVAPFATELGARDRKRMLANISYVAGRYKWTIGESSVARGLLVKSLRGGRVDVRLKSLITLGQILLRGAQR